MKVNALGINMEEALNKNNNSNGSVNALGFKAQYAWNGNIKTKESSKSKNNNGSSSSASGGVQTSQTKQIDKTIQTLKDRVQSIKDSDMTDEEKKTQIDMIQSQIELLESQKQQIQIAEKKKQIEENNEKIEEKNEKIQENNQYKVNSDDDIKGGVVVDGSLNKLIKADSKLKEVRYFKETATRLQVEKSYVEDMENTDFNKKQISKLSRGIAGLESNINLAAVDAYKITKKAEEKAIEDKKEEDKQKKVDKYA